MPIKKTGEMVICNVCDKEFYLHACRIKKRKIHHCSSQCRGISMRGKRQSPNSEFKKGQQGYWTGRKRPPFSKECREKMSNSRKGEKGSNWQGGIMKHSGYILIHAPNHPFCEHHGYVRKHRLVVEKHINRHLLPSEVVHHVNKNTSDNRLENLMVFINNGFHIKFERNKPVPSHAIVFDGRKLARPISPGDRTLNLGVLATS